MKLSLGLTDALQGPYLARDCVRASLEIRGPAFQKSPRISAKLAGALMVSYPTQINAASPGQVTNVLFEQSKTIDYRDLQWSEDASTGESIYTTPVEFQFPAGACYCDKSKKCQLPPTMDVAEQGMRVKVKYTLTVSVGRSVLGPMTKSKSVAMEVPFSCNPSTSKLPRSTFVLSVPMAEKPGQQLAQLRSAAEDQERPDGSCPSYNPKSAPCIKLEFIFSQPAVLIRGQPTPVRIVVHTPTDLIEAGNVYLRHISMDLKSSVTTSTGALPKTVTQRNRGLSMAGAVKIDSELFELDSGAWGNFFVLNTKPTTESCVLKLGHVMEMVAGISIGLGNDIKYAGAAYEVIVMEPPPAYESTTKSECVSNGE
ncbi:hypothetical protein BBK36DRAFT_1159559 [Trichoderma citrinoviride]|uniref:Arrestin-like N-terminal domain-containing protein n=1 Tax=Trichoderma citrinoviride TaxID=58853 RepID=A0A2T4BB34_9HYPO|nr:hypothetical protein BBK36DRAFT_1159559 [Trichoderma citrinoviride]PTB66527.1 hypothetical protein BBK36DRAFT_1159559 [Trichoderma citrinoviride]